MGAEINEQVEVEKFFRITEVMEITRLSDRTVRQMVADGRLPAVRLAGLRVVLIPASAVRALMAGRVER